MSYDSWQKRTKYPVSSCPICGDSFEFVNPETHHHPKTLFTVVEDILQKHIDLNDIDNYTDFDICQEIMDAHFQKKVNYIVLCKHCHEKYHNDVPDILDAIDECMLKQRQEIKDFYEKEIDGTEESRKKEENSIE
jgi:transcription elongation factor Elf1